MSNPQAVIERAASRNLGSAQVIQFPLEGSPHFFLLTLTNYRTSDPEENKFTSDETIGYYSLPIPAGIVDNYGMNYNGTEFGALGRFAFNAGEALTNVFDKIGTDGGPALTDVINAFDGVSTGGLAKAIARKVARLDAGVGGAIDRVTGTAFNPHLTTTFEGQKLRTFQFTWRIYPQSAQESQDIQRILGDIRKYMHPTQGEAFNFEGTEIGGEMFGGGKDIFLLRYPAEAFAAVYAGHSKPILSIGRSVITDLSINFAPSGTPAFFRGTNNPSEMEFTIQMQEVAAMVREDLDQMQDYISGQDTV